MKSDRDVDREARGRGGRDSAGASLDCLDGTPLVDLKPERAGFTPIAPPQPGDFETNQDSPT